jgi:hypothetical protein
MNHRVYKFKLKVESQTAWQFLLSFSKSSTAAYNFAAERAVEDDQKRQADIDAKFEVWKQHNPVEGAAYDAEMAEYKKQRETFLELERKAKKGECPWPEEPEYPERPVKIKSDVKRRRSDEVTDLWSQARGSLVVTLNADDASKKTEVHGEDLFLNSQKEVLRSVDASVSGTIKRRTDGFCASVPHPKPEYSDHPFKLFKTGGQFIFHQAIGDKGQLQHSVILSKGRGRNHQVVKLRFFPNRPISYGDVKTIQIGRFRGTCNWWIGISIDASMSNVSLPNRAIGVDVNSGYGNNIVVSDINGELYRRAIPDEMARVNTKIEETQREKDRVLEANGHNYKSRQVRMLRRRIRQLHGHLANIRKNWLHHCSKEIVMSGNLVSLEKLNIQKLTKSAKGTPSNPGKGVAAQSRKTRKMLGVAPGMLKEMVEYKSHALSQSRVAEVDPAGTSSKCCYCGKKGLRHSNFKLFRCTNSKCAYHGIDRDADENGSMNIVRRAVAGKCKIIEKPTGQTKIAQMHSKRMQKLANKALQAGAANATTGNVTPLPSVSPAPLSAAS